MQLHSNTQVGTPHEALIVACCEPVRKLARSFAMSRSDLDVDDLYDAAMLTVCELAHRAMPLENPIGYLCRCARNVMISEWRTRCRFSQVSLDASPGGDEEGKSSLIDVLVMPVVVSSSDVDEQMEQAVQVALARLSPPAQMVLMQQYGFVGSGALSLEEMAERMGKSVGAVKSQSWRARAKLRADVQLRQALGMEVAS